MNKIIILLCLAYIFNVSSVEPLNDCLCGRSAVVKYVLEFKENISKKIDNIPHNAKKILANGLVKAENLYDITKDSISNGIDYIKDIIESVMNWAHETHHN
jgi:hypothetical protein